MAHQAEFEGQPFKRSGMLDVPKSLAGMPSDGTEVPSAIQLTTATAKDGITLPRKRISISSTTTVCLEAQQTFSAGSAAAYGSITARRVR
jgi:hypothetical protein